MISYKKPELLRFNYVFALDKQAGDIVGRKEEDWQLYTVVLAALKKFYRGGLLRKYTQVDRTVLPGSRTSNHM